ncbi:MAG: RNA polymerase sigma-70 factor [Cyclobacteriaceae bacterium]|nr:RNA polymerase sigma-70 factor [Cyclobacteriaceae bacterium]
MLSGNHQDIEAFKVKIKAGCLLSFNLLFRKLSHKVFQFSYSFLHCREEAEEIMQDVFLKVWESKHLLNESKSLYSYIYVIAKNATLDKIRKNKSQSLHLHRYFDLHEDQFIALPEFQQELSDTTLVIQKILSDMPAARKRVFELSRYQGMSNSSIAEYLSISVKTVEKQISKALQELKEKLKNNEIEVCILLTISFLSYSFF